MNQPYRLKAPSREDIESQIPFPIEKNADKRFSYHFIGKDELEEAEYDKDGNMTKEPVLSDYVLADLAVYTDKEITFSDPVEVLDPNSPMHGWT